MGASYVVQRRYEEMAPAFDAAEQELGENADEPAGPWWKEKVHIQLERMHLFYWQGMSDEMMQLAGQYRARVETKGTPIQRGKFFQMLALSHLTRARYVAPEESLRLAELAVSMSEGCHATFPTTAFMRVVAAVRLWAICRGFEEHRREV